MKPSKTFLINCLKHQISIIKENLAKGLNSLKSYVLDLIDLETKLEKLENMKKEPVYIFADDCGEFTRDNTVNGGERLVLPKNYIHGVGVVECPSDAIISALKRIDFSAKLWEKGDHKRLYITCWNTQSRSSDSGKKVGYIDLINKKYCAEGESRLCNMVRDAIKGIL